MAALRCGRNSCGIYHHSARLSSSTSVSWKRGGAGDKFSETTSRRIPSLLHQQSLRVANNNNFHLVPLDEKIPPTEDHLSAQNHQQKQQKTYEACFDGEFSQLFRFQLPEGYCVGISLRFLPLDSTSSLVQQEQDQQRRHWLHRYLHPEEISFGYKLKEGVARNTFFLGRLAIRHALFYYNLDGPKSNSTEICSSEIQQYNSAPSATPSSKNSSLKNALHETPSFSILKDKHGRPELPRGFLGSISHKDNIGVALVALIDSAKSRGGTRQGIGIDIEKCEPRSSRIARRVLTLREVESLGHLPNVTMDEEVMLRFSLKESIYKAMHPLICQYVGFQEVEVTPNADGTAQVNFMLRSNAHLTFKETCVHWRRVLDNNFFLTSARISGSTC